MRENMKFGILIVIGVLIILFIWLKLIDLAYSDENDKIILVAAIGLIGAIIGGAISGGLTLMGVSLTIKNADKAERLKQTPEKIEIADKLISDFMRIKAVFQDFTYKSYSIPLVLEKTLEILEEEKSLVKAIKVSEKSYRTVKKFDENLKSGINEINRMDFMQLYGINANASEKIYQELFQEAEECLVVLSKEDNKIKEFFFN